MSWRPEEGWNPSEIRQKTLEMCAESEPGADCQIKLVEAGANALLEALKATGIHGDYLAEGAVVNLDDDGVYDLVDHCDSDGPGTLIWIKDEEVQDVAT